MYINHTLTCSYLQKCVDIETWNLCSVNWRRCNSGKIYLRGRLSLRAYNLYVYFSGIVAGCNYALVNDTKLRRRWYSWTSIFSPHCFASFSPSNVFQRIKLGCLYIEELAPQFLNNARLHYLRKLLYLDDFWIMEFMYHFLLQIYHDRKIHSHIFGVHNYVYHTVVIAKIVCCMSFIPHLHQFIISILNVYISMRVTYEQRTDWNSLNILCASYASVSCFVIVIPYIDDCLNAY